MWKPYMMEEYSSDNPLPEAYLLSSAIWSDAGKGIIYSSLVCSLLYNYIYYVVKFYKGILFNLFSDKDKFQTLFATDPFFIENFTKEGVGTTKLPVRYLMFVALSFQLTSTRQ